MRYEIYLNIILLREREREREREKERETHHGEQVGGGGFDGPPQHVVLFDDVVLLRLGHAPSAGLLRVRPAHRVTRYIPKLIPTGGHLKVNQISVYRI